MKLTDKNAAALTLPAGKSEHFEWCDSQPGFGIRIRKVGSEIARRWYCQYRINNRQRREALGDVRKVKVETARSIAMQRFGKVASGEDPAADKAKAAADALKLSRTFDKVVDLYLDAKKSDLRPSTYAAAERYLKKHFAALHATPIADITRADIATELRSLVKNHGKTAASRARMNLSAVFAWSIGEGITEANTVTGTNDPDTYKPRERTLSDDELRTIWNTCQDDAYGQIIKLLILTGCRRAEIGDLSWPEVNLETGVMTLPASRVKNAEKLVLTLPPSALAILKAIPKNQYRDDFVFGKRGKSGFCAWSYCTLALNGRIAASGTILEPWTLHDIRRTVRTGLGRIGIAPHVAERVIGHLPPKLQRTYDKHDYSADIKSALLRWADHVEAVVEGRASNVVALQQSA